MLQIGVCDDSQDARLTLRSALERLLEKREIQYRTYEFSSGEGLLGWMGKHQAELDLVFLDIEMKELNGMETAHRLRQADSGLQLVFVTGYTDYVYDGYAVGALGYLLKPTKPQQLDDILTRALSALCRDINEVFVCRNGEVSYRIGRKDILYFASDRRQVQCVTAARSYTFTENWMKWNGSFPINALSAYISATLSIPLRWNVWTAAKLHCRATSLCRSAARARLQQWQH